MAQYQLRGWQGWGRHIAMVTLAMLFMTKQKLINREDTPLLSMHDVVELLDFYLPAKQNPNR